MRELQNLVEGAVSLADGRIDADLLRSLMGSPRRRERRRRRRAGAAGPEPLDLEAVERRHIARVLQLAHGNKSEAARILGLDRKTLQRKGF